MDIKVLPIALLLLPGLALGAVTDDPAENDDLAEQILPTQRIEFGVGSVGANRSGFGAQMGLGKSSQDTAGWAFGGIDLRGGDRFDTTEARRWRFRWEEFGLDARSVAAELGEQGRYGVRFTHDQSYFLMSDNYQTPLHAAGSASLTTGFTGLTKPSSLPASAFSAFPLGIERGRDEVQAHTVLTDTLTLRAGYQHQTRDGAKGTGAVSGSVGGTVMMLPEPIHQTLDTFNLNLAYGEGKQHLNMAYVGSIFRNQVDQLDFQNPFTSGTFANRLSTAPDNQLHQLKLDGGMSFSSATRLTGTWTRGRLTQNEAFLPYSAVSTQSLGSLNGLVLSEHRFLQLSHRVSRDMNIRASYRYDDRDNQTPVRTFKSSTDDKSIAALEAGTYSTYSATNSPYRRQRSTALLEADYALSRSSTLVLGTEQESLQRTCRSVDARCVEAERSHENVWRSELRHSFNDWVTGRMGFRYGDRRVDDYVPVDATVDLSGMRKFIYANRQREQWWASSTLLATEALAFNLRVDVNNDRYQESQYGLDKAGSWVAHLDASYTLSDDVTVYAYLSRQAILSRLNSRYSKNATELTLDKPDQAWLARAQDDINAVGLGLNHQGLLAGRLTLNVDLNWVDTANRNQLSGGSCTNSTCASTLADLPIVRSHQVFLRSDARYSLTTDTTVRVLGLFSYLRNHDFAYEQYAYDAPTVASATAYSKVVNTYETPANYLGYFVGVSLIHQFR